MDVRAEINVTPMIDVLLVLLVVFMISIQYRSLLSVNVPPPAERASSRGAPQQLLLEVKDDGSYAINGSATDVAVLPARLHALAEGRNLIFVRAAPHRPYREIVRAVDLAKGAGFQIVGYMP